MLTIFSDLRDITTMSVLFRMLLSVICGLLIGLERSSKNRPAGFRTHMLVCIGACAASLTGHFLYLNRGIPTDVTRLGAQVISGLGFIGTGTILVTRDRSVRGLTTAAGLWTCGIVGLACGAGFYEGALLTTAAVLLIETLFGRFSKFILHPKMYQIVVGYDHRDSIDALQEYCKDRRLNVTSLRIGKNRPGSKDDSKEDASRPAPPRFSAFVTLRAGRGVDTEALLEEFRKIKGIRSATLVKREA